MADADLRREPDRHARRTRCKFPSVVQRGDGESSTNHRPALQLPVQQSIIEWQSDASGGMISGAGPIGVILSSPNSPRSVIGMSHPRLRQSLLACVLGLGLGAAVASGADDYRHRVEQVLLRTPLIDGHNDLPWEIRDRFKGDLAAVDLSADTTHLPFPADASPLMTDLPRMHAGGMGGQFWSVWIPSEMKGPEAVQTTLEQMDLVKRMVARYP